MRQVDNDTFLQQLATLFESRKEKGSIWLTHKRVSHDGEDVVMTDNASTREYSCLLRATDGKQTKFSTQISPSQLPKFYAAYGTLLKTSMTTLRKRDKKREKQRSDRANARKQRMTTPIPIEGPKRGNGRRKRQRRIKAALKQESSKQKYVEREEAKAKAKLP